ncbi:MAG: nucleotidyltransferase family protein [Daejeonella sp.]
MKRESTEALIVKKFAVIILAAGSSSRFGSPKQLLVYRHKTLLQNCIDNAKQVHGNPLLLLVLGAHKELIKDQIDIRNVTVIENNNWESGMASSITSAVTTLQADFPDTDGMILMVCDQPFADRVILTELLLKQKDTGKAIVASAYDGTHGTPAFFHRSMFSELLDLKGDTGAKKILEKYKNLSAYVSFNAGGIDIDTSEDYKILAE